MQRCGELNQYDHMQLKMPRDMGNQVRHNKRVYRMTGHKYVKISVITKLLQRFYNKI